MAISISIPDHLAYGSDEQRPARTHGQNVADAACCTVRNYPGGAAALAPRLGMSVNTLLHKTNPATTTHILSIEEAMLLQEFTGNHTILHAMAEALGYTCARATPDQADGDPTESIMRLEVAHADLIRALADGVLAGPTGVTSNHMRRAVHMGEEAIATIGHSLAMLRGRIRPAPKTEG